MKEGGFKRKYIKVVKKMSMEKSTETDNENIWDREIDVLDIRPTDKRLALVSTLVSSLIHDHSRPNETKEEQVNTMQKGSANIAMSQNSK